MGLFLLPEPARLSACFSRVCGAYVADVLKFAAFCETPCHADNKMSDKIEKNAEFFITIMNIPFLCP
jgi:hypothetical protein